MFRCSDCLFRAQEARITHLQQCWKKRGRFSWLSAVCHCSEILMLCFVCHNSDKGHQRFFFLSFFFLFTKMITSSIPHCGRGFYPSRRGCILMGAKCKNSHVLMFRMHVKGPLVVKIILECPAAVCLMIILGKHGECGRWKP